MADVLVTVSLDSVDPAEVGWGYTYEDGSFYAWVGYPELLFGARDTQGNVPLLITAPKANGETEILYRDPARMSDDGTLSPIVAGPNGRNFDLVVSSGEVASDDPYEEAATPTLTGSLRSPGGGPVGDTVITVSVEPDGPAGATEAIGWAYAWPDGTFQTWIAHPGLLEATRDENGLVALVFTATTPQGALNQRIVASSSADGVLLPHGGSAFTLVVNGSTPPVDDPSAGTPTSEKVASLLSRASGTAGTEANPTDALLESAGDQAQGEGATVTAGANATASITSGKIPLQVDLPGNSGAGLQVSGNGTAVLPGAQNNLDVAVQSSDSGAVRLNSVLNNAGAPTVQSYGLTLPAGARLQPIAGDGGYLVVVKENTLPAPTDPDPADTYDYPAVAGSAAATSATAATSTSSDTEEPLYEEGEADELAAMVGLAADEVAAFRIETPWAVDTAGRSLPTSYSVSGNTLTQSIDTRGATYPVVADPAFIPVIVWLTVAAGRAAAPAVARAFAAKAIKQTLKATTKGGYKKFKDFKKKHVTGKEKTHDWHHIVEQSNISRHGWDPRTIHNRNNLVQVPRKIHQQCVSARMSMKNVSVPGRGNIRGHSSGPYNTLRDSVKNLTWERQYQIGVLLLQYCGLKI